MKTGEQMPLKKTNILSLILACVGVLSLIGVAIFFARRSATASARNESSWENVAVTRKPSDVKNMTKFGTVSVSMRILSNDSSSLRQAAIATMKRDAAKAGATTVLIQNEHFSLTPTPNILLVGSEYKTYRPSTIIINFIHEVIKKPRGYLPVLLVLAILVSFWGTLCVSSLISFGASTRSRRFWFALPPLLFGFMGIFAKLPITIGAEGGVLSFDLRWLFLIPLVLGITGLVWWQRTRSEAVA